MQTDVVKQTITTTTERKNDVICSIIMARAIKEILSSMRGVFLPYQGDSSRIPGGKVRIDDLSYYGIYSGRKSMSGDFSRFADDFKKSVDEAKRKSKK